MVIDYVTTMKIPGVIDLMGAKITWKAVENRIGLHNMEI